MTDESDPGPEIRRAQRVLLMVHELHKRGRQLLRVVPGMAASGCHWRCSVTHAGNILKSDGALPRHFDSEAAHYSSGMGDAYFGWEDARDDDAPALAAKFEERFAAIAEKGRGDDWEYAGWYVRMLGFAERSELPVAYADWYDEPSPEWLPTTRGFESGLPRPPGGRADRDP